MRFFTLLLDPDGRGIPGETCRQYEALPRRRGLEYEWQTFDHGAVLTAWDDPYGDPLVARAGTWIAVGMVRLDNRADVERWIDGPGQALSDLELVLRLVASHGTKLVSELLGDFAFVVWDSTSRRAVAAVDAFAVKRLFRAERQGLFALASRAEALALEERYEVEYLVKLLALHTSARDLSVYAGVRPVPAACMAVLDGSGLRVLPYWSPAAFHVEYAWEQSEEETVREFRRLLGTSVRLRMGSEHETWAQLSGGLDSSSIVSLIQWLVERGELRHGIAGTVTYVDRQGTGADEREYSDAVVHRWGVRNELIVDPPTWYDESCALPWTDQPSFDLQSYPRERRLCATVTAAGGRILLTGWGGDELLMGSMLFFADWVAQGHVLTAVRQMARTAAQGRVSFWELAYRNALGPLLPKPARDRLLRDRYGTPVMPWLGPAILERYSINTRNRLAPDYAGRLGHKYEHAVGTKIASLAELTDRGILDDALDVRHPFLYRPLVEFVLRLPPHLRARPHAHRWILREAMRGILPEKVRTRVGKSDTGGVLAWSLMSERARLAELVHDPILGELGVIDAPRLGTSFGEVLGGRRDSGYMHANLFSTLAVEAWLRMQCGRWPSQGSLVANAVA